MKTEIQIHYCKIWRPEIKVLNIIQIIFMEYAQLGYFLRINFWLFKDFIGCLFLIPAIFSNCLALVPSIMLTVSRLGLTKEKHRLIKFILDFVSIFAQISAIFIIPILYWKNGTPLTETEWALPVGLVI